LSVRAGQMRAARQRSWPASARPRSKRTWGSILAGSPGVPAQESRMTKQKPGRARLKEQIPAADPDNGSRVHRSVDPASQGRGVSGDGEKDDLTHGRM